MISTGVSSTACYTRHVIHQDLKPSHTLLGECKQRLYHGNDDAGMVCVKRITMGD